MKKFYKSLIPFFGVSFSLLNNNIFSFAKNVTEPKEIFISTKLEKKVDLQDRGKLTFEKEKKILNQTKVFLLVKKTVNNKQKLEKNVLLLLGPEEHLNATKDNYTTRQNSHIIRSQHYLDKNTKRYKSKAPKYNIKSKFTVIDDVGSLMARTSRNVDCELVLMADKKRNPFTSVFRGGKSYFVHSEGGYKSICPVFLNENSAKKFLIENTEKDFENLIECTDIVKGESIKSKQFKLPFLSGKKSNNIDRFPKLMKNVQNVKIIRLGLGDFIEYYSTFPNEKALEKVDFFFVPDLEPLITQSTRRMLATKEDQTTKILGKNKIKLKGFKSYQKQLYEIRK